MSDRPHGGWGTPWNIQPEDMAVKGILDQNADLTRERNDLRASLASERDTSRRLRQALERIGREQLVEVPCDPTDETKTETLCQFCACDPHDDECLIGIARSALASLPEWTAPTLEPHWRPCFLCKEHVEVPFIPSDDDGAGLVPICGPCRRGTATRVDPGTVEICAKLAEQSQYFGPSGVGTHIAGRIRALAVPSEPRTEPGPSLAHKAACSSWVGGLCTCRLSIIDEVVPASEVQGHYRAVDKIMTEPTCPTCKGKKRVFKFSSGLEDCPRCTPPVGATGERRSHFEHVDIEPSATPVGERECAGWCGTPWNKHDHGMNELRYQDESRDHCYCTPACRDAGKPLHPRTPKEGRECECPPGVVSSTCSVHGYGYP